LPDALFVIDVCKERTAIKEANRLKIPVVAIVDTNCDPDGIDYVVPGNDDSAKAIALYLRELVASINDARSTIIEEKPSKEKYAVSDKNPLPTKAKKKVFTSRAPHEERSEKPFVKDHAKVTKETTDKRTHQHHDAPAHQSVSKVKIADASEVKAAVGSEESKAE
jgi:small subunit ribosomal protein S2